MVYFLVKASGANKYDIIEIRDVKKGIGRQERYPAFLVFTVPGDASTLWHFQDMDKDFERIYFYNYDSHVNETTLTIMKFDPDFHPEISISDIYCKV